MARLDLQLLPFPASPLSLASCFPSSSSELPVPYPHLPPTPPPPQHLCAPLQRPLSSCPLFSLVCAPGTPTSCSPQARPAQHWNEVGTRVGPRGACPNHCLSRGALSPLFIFLGLSSRELMAAMGQELHFRLTEVDRHTLSVKQGRKQAQDRNGCACSQEDPSL